MTPKNESLEADDESVGSNSGSMSDTGTASSKVERSRDEEEEIRKQSQKETARVRFWRTLVFLALLATAVSVTATTYSLLVKQEDENFRNVVSQVNSKAARDPLLAFSCSTRI